MLALRPLRGSTRGLHSTALRSADSGESSSAYLRRQAALEDLEDALPKTPREPAVASKDQSVFERATRKSSPKLLDQTTAPWEGEETQRKLVERVLQDSYKPLRVRHCTVDSRSLLIHCSLQRSKDSSKRSLRQLRYRTISSTLHPKHHHPSRRTPTRTIRSKRPIRTTPIPPISTWDPRSSQRRNERNSLLPER